MVIVVLIRVMLVVNAMIGLEHSARFWFNEMYLEVK